jgi:hypothetical protein
VLVRAFAAVAFIPLEALNVRQVEHEHVYMMDIYVVELYDQANREVKPFLLTYNCWFNAPFLPPKDPP